MKHIIICIVLACFISVFFCLPIALAKDEIKVDNIKVANGKVYKVGDGGLKIATVYYIDRTFVVNAMPKDLEGVTWIMTANDDKQSVGAEFLKFTVDRPVVVWLARDSRGDIDKGGKTPEWLSENKGWERHKDMLIEVSDTNMGNFVLWSKGFDKGEIVLGGNADPPAAGQNSNYIVLLTPGKTLAVKPSGKLNTTWAELKSQR